MSSIICTQTVHVPVSRSQTVNTDYEVGGVGDFNADGIADILWRHNTGKKCHLSYMHADGSRTSKRITTVNTDYEVGGLGDFNADGVADILWRHNTGRNVIYYMHADGSRTSQDITTLSTDYIPIF